MPLIDADGRHPSSSLSAAVLSCLSMQDTAAFEQSSTSSFRHFENAGETAMSNQISADCVHVQAAGVGEEIAKLKGDFTSDSIREHSSSSDFSVCRFPVAAVDLV